MAAALPPDARLARLASSLQSSTPAPADGVALEALLDAFLALFDECSYSELKREKVIADFVKDCTPAAVTRREARDARREAGRGRGARGRR